MYTYWLYGYCCQITALLRPGLAGAFDMGAFVVNSDNTAIVMSN